MSIYSRYRPGQARQNTAWNNDLNRFQQLSGANLGNNLDFRRPSQLVDGASWIDNRGRKCRIVCDSEAPREPRLERFSRMLVGRNINLAQRFYPNIRVIEKNGMPLPTTMDYRPERINVATRNDIITRVVSIG